ncbi:MAG: hypothetical protein HYY23_03220 [Verrucomicrobia bacterium]|nr:hypothetical protein [Verrucomicrobiota bacterium]
MNPDRSTDGFTPLTYLNLIQRGGTEDWKRLYRLCHDPGIARQVASMLPMRDPDLLASARIWKFLLEDLHPELNLSIDLKESRRSIGV